MREKLKERMTVGRSWAICRILKAGLALQKRLELCVVRHNLTGVLRTNWYLPTDTDKDNLTE